MNKNEILAYLKKERDKQVVDRHDLHYQAYQHAYNVLDDLSTMRHGMLLLN